MDHPPPPKTSVEKVKIINNITTPVLEKPLKNYIITTTNISRLEKELMVEATLTSTVEPKIKNNSCVVSVMIGSKFSQFFHKIVNNKYKYCQVMNYTCYIFKNIIINESRPLAWQKVHAIDKVMRNGCNTLFWIDGDAIIMDYKEIPKTTKDIALTRDFNGINTGIMVIKNNNWTDNFFHRVANTTTYNFHPWWEQAAIIKYFETELITRQHIEFINQQYYNSYNVIKSKFIYHPAGCSNNCNYNWKKALQLTRVK